MRVHRLSVQAFGPFADRQDIDFDSLSSAGLFLLNGETGAGKTSILDAICYALYAGLPGDREGSKSLRSDHAGPGLAPEVTCEFSTGSRRFEVTRSPAWARPAKRGSGTTTAQAQSRLREFIDGSWVEKSTRNDEVGAELHQAIGLGKDEFTKVAMLPQGAFAAFLRAKDKEREQLLKSLFDTATYGAVEALLAAELTEARTAADAAGRGHDAARSTLLADAGTSLWARDETPPGFLDGESAEAASLDDAGLCDLIADRLAERSSVLGAAEAAATALAEDAAIEAGSLARRTEDHARLAELSGLRTTHEQGAAEAAAQQEKLGLHAAASSIGTVLGGRDRALADSLTAADASAAAQARVETHEWATGYLKDAGEEGTVAERAARAARHATEEAAVLEASLPDEQALAAGERELETAGARETERATALVALTAEKERLEGGIPVRREQLEGQRALAARTADLKTTVDAAEVRVAAVAAGAVAEKKTNKAQKAFLAAKEARLAEESTLLGIGRTRLAQAAAALAAGLEDGCACPVCGSADHPEPATAEEGELLGEDVEEEARARLKKALAVEDKASGVLEAARARENVAKGKAGGLDKAQADALLEAATAEYRLSARSLKEAVTAKAALDAAEARLKLISAEAAGESTALELLRARIAHLRAEGERLAGKLEGLRAGAGSLKVRHLQVREAAERLDALASAGTRAETTALAAQAAAGRWEVARNGAGFETDALHAAALLSGDEAAQLAERLEGHRSDGIRLKTLASAPEVERARADLAAGIPAPEAEALQAANQALAAAKTARDAAVREAAVLGSYAQRLESQRRELAGLAAAQGPVLARFATARAMAELARGGGENRFKMSLTTYVLAARLEAVAVAATERLAVMTGERYALVHDDGPKGNNRSGLGLHVLDSWTGARRDTRTLSGGESFMASLALALGLADVIQHQSGGIDIETLFVDEGFGSLDEETLEQVMDALENLRSGGRVVGLVSHVADMKQRITTQLRVRKGRNGSTVSLHLGG